MWVVDIIENCITLWNSTLSSIWSMLTQSPETFHNGAVWDAITKIFTALQGAGYGLLVLFFAVPGREQGAGRVDRFAQIVRRDIGRHADGDA